MRVRSIKVMSTELEACLNRLSSLEELRCEMKDCIYLKHQLEHDVQMSGTSIDPISLCLSILRNLIIFNLFRNTLPRKA